MYPSLLPPSEPISPSPVTIVSVLRGSSLSSSAKLDAEILHLNQHHQRAASMANPLKSVVAEKRLIDQHINEHGTEPDSLALLEMAT
ncbi:hypothetical protein FNYG_05740 [Fusarium nygamai]|uniref:Uncharacterized protein n=1 Tax=Gibberella nygamai TaxID=42673 RepID=A0A2K0WF73_GIBNY|nr:hypothetical protein FNYG_05740 [Fusarium nygamai]